MSRKNIIKLLLIISFIATLLYFNQKYVNLSPQDIRGWILSFGLFAPIVYIILYTVRPLVLFPASILSLTAGLAFGALWGTVYTIIGATLGGVLSFLVARKIGGSLLTQKTNGPRMVKLKEQLESNGLFYVLLLRLIPVFNFDLISYLAGVSKVRFSHFVLGTVIGIIPGTFAYNFLGSSIVGANIWIIIAAILIFISVSIFPLLVSSKLRKKLGLIKEEREENA